MRFPSNSLSIFRWFGGIQEPNDADMDIESNIDLVLEVPRAFTTFEDGTGPTLNDSAIISRTLDRGASTAGAIVNLVTLTPGLWDVTITYTYAANFALGAPFGVLSGLASPQNNTFVTVGQGFPTGGGIVQGVFKARLALNANFTFQIGVPTTVVAQAATTSASVVANRLG